MNYYGIDLHSDQFTVAQLNQDDKFNLFKFSVSPIGIESFKKMLSKGDTVGFESSTNAFYFHDQLANCVSSCKVINPKKFKVIYESTSKTDKKDAKTIAKFLKLDIIPEVYVPTSEIRELRTYFSSYLLFNKIKVISKNRVCSLLKQNGISLKREKVFSSKNREAILNLDLPKSFIFQINLFYQQVDFAERQLEFLTEQIYLCGEHFKKEVEILTSQPGISVFIALGIIADIAEIKRFANQRKFTSYLGSAPRVDTTNKTVHIGGIHKDSRKLARTLMTKSIKHFRDSSEHLEKFYQFKIKGKSKGKVRMAIIRKMMVAIYWMLRNKKYSRYRNPVNHDRKLKEYNKILERLHNTYLG